MSLNLGKYMGNDEIQTTVLNQGLQHKHFSQCTCILSPVCFFLTLGDIQVGMMDKKGQLEVEIIRARGLVVKPGSKTLPGKNMKFFSYSS